MSVRLIEWQKPFTGWAWIEIDANKVISLLLREENNLIMINDNDEAYVDLQFEGWLTPNSDFPVWVTVWKVLAEDGWEQNGLVLNRKTTSWDYARWIYAADWKIFFDNWTWTWKRVYYSEEVDAAFQPLLTAWPWISIVNNVISATGWWWGGGSWKIDYFEISDNTDIANAQLAYNFFLWWGLPIVNYGQVLYAPQASTSSLFSLGSISANWFVSEEDDVHWVTTTTIAKLNFSLSSDIVTGITEGDMVMSSPFLETNYNYPNTYQPLYDGSPATKKYVDDKFSTLMWLGKFLSLWDCSTWLPISFPLTTPYTYHTWDYFMIETVASGWGNNYRPNGSSYTGTASSTTESEAVQKWDFYIYDGTVWLFASNHGWSVSFSNIAGQPTDNAALATALNNKQNTLIAWTDLSITPWTEIFTLPTWYTQLDYIGLDGVWYFNTGITLADTDKLDITFTTSPDYTWTYFLWGKNGSSGQSIWFISPSANLVQWNDRPTSVSLSVWTKVFLKLKSGELVYTALGTTETKTFTWGSVSSTWVCLIWGAWDGTSNVDSRRFYGYIHKRQILDSTDTLRFNWVPCKNSSDQYWLYDTVSNTFIQSAVTATITGWPEATASDMINFTNTSRYIKNTATGDGSITIWSSNPAPWNNWVNIGTGSYSAWYAVWIGSGAYANWGYGIAIGNSSAAANTSAIAIGRWAKAQALNSISIGRDATTSALNWIAIWKDAKNSSAYAIQLGKGTIGGASNEYQFYVGFDGINVNYKMLDGTTWLIPNDRLHDEVLVTVGTTQPATPATWKLWYDTTNSVLKLYDGANRQTI